MTVNVLDPAVHYFCTINYKNWLLVSAPLVYGCFHIWTQALFGLGEGCGRQPHVYNSGCGWEANWLLEVIHIISKFMFCLFQLFNILLHFCWILMHLQQRAVVAPLLTVRFHCCIPTWAHWTLHWLCTCGLAEWLIATFVFTHTASLSNVQTTEPQYFWLLCERAYYD